jgi:hypothetical protein
MNREEFLAFRNASMQGRFLQERLPANKWNEFVDRARDVFESSFPDVFPLRQQAFFCIGRKL